MKKFFYALMVLAVMVVTASCGNDEPDNKTLKCWEVTTAYAGYSGSVYVWTTESLIANTVNYTKKTLELEGIKNFTVTYRQNNAKTEEACEAQNKENPQPSDTKFCWQMTYNSKEGAKIVEYQWMTQEEAEEYIDKHAGAGDWQIKIANAADEAACKALNNGETPNPPDTEFDNTTFKCWAVTTSIAGASETGYIWATEYMINAIIIPEVMSKYPQAVISYREADAADEEACDALNPEEQEEEDACWKVTIINADGQTETGYHWTTEEGVKAYIEGRGGRGTYEKAAADDFDSCEKLNEDVPGPGPEEFNGDDYDNITSKCWKVVTTVSGVSVTNFVWSTEYAIAYTIWAGQLDCVYSLADAADKDACDALNEEVQGESFCWKITFSVMGMEYEQYAWLSEEDIAAAAGLIKQKIEEQLGMTVEMSYSKADAADEESCDALNPINPGEGEASCWVLTVIYGGMPVYTYYEWASEDDVKTSIEMAKAYYEQMAQGQVSIDVTYTAADAADEDACDALNGDEEEGADNVIKALIRARVK